MAIFIITGEQIFASQLSSALALAGTDTTKPPIDAAVALAPTFQNTRFKASSQGLTYVIACICDSFGGQFIVPRSGPFEVDEGQTQNATGIVAGNRVRAYIRAVADSTFGYGSAAAANAALIGTNFASILAVTQVTYPSAIIYGYATTAWQDTAEVGPDNHNAQGVVVVGLP